MKTNKKTGLRLFKNHLIRLITIMAIVVVSVGFMSGIGEIEGKLKTATSNYYTSQNISDLNIKSTNKTGFSQKEISWIKNKFGEENMQKGFYYETKINNEVTRVCTFDLSNSFANLNINKLELIEGNYPTKDYDILIGHRMDGEIKYSINDKVEIFGNKYTICGIVVNPLYISDFDDPSFQYADENVNYTFYVNSKAPPMINDIFIKLSDRSLFKKTFSNKYSSLIETTKSEILTTSELNNIVVLSLYDNYGIYSLVDYAEKIGMIGIVFVIFFMLVTLLVVYSTMSRLLAEERSQIACQKTLGYSDFAIIKKYLLFVLIATLVGSIIAYPVGYILTYLIYNAFNLKYAMPAFPINLEVFYYLITVSIILFTILFLTFLTGMNIVKNKPSTLLIPKSPKSGKKVILEKIPFIWNRLSFKYKSTFRNILLFKSRFFMTVISITGSSILVFCGMGLINCSTSIEGGESLKTISLVLMIFSALLCALVIYNLTNINISERNREIATLMVLGYHNNEVKGYIFREVYIMSLIGAVLGLPLGIAFIEFVFSLISFGSLDKIKWWSYVLAPIITMIFSFLSTLLLKNKITNTNMNESLKTLE